ncbi:hypothetical protein TNCV_3607981 [Trichonephila clavipes]|nr:hypothetical protein TNCV_3607981 [Trichonephila clavipes]
MGRLKKSVTIQAFRPVVFRRAKPLRTMHPKLAVNNRLEIRSSRNIISWIFSPTAMMPITRIGIRLELYYPIRNKLPVI